MKSNHLPKQRWLTPILPSIQGIGTILENRTVFRSPGIRSHYRLDESWCDISRFILAMDLPQNLRELVSSGDNNGARRLSPFFLGCTKLMILFSDPPLKPSFPSLQMLQRQFFHTEAYPQEQRARHANS